MTYLRHILSVLALAALAIVAAPQEADAIFHQAQLQSSGGGTQLTTLSLVNTSGSTQATNFITPMFGHAFKKGDVASGCTTGGPKFQLSGGTNVPFSESSDPICWNDGSLKFAAFMLRVPSTIAGSGTLTVNVLNGGTYPSASSRTTADFTAGSHDLNVQVACLDNCTGTWESDLGQGVTANGPDYKYMDGAAGAVWRIPANFRQSGADHGQLVGWWYAASLQDASGNLAGIRYLTRVTQPWYNVSSPVTPEFRAFTSFQTLDGASQLIDHWGSLGNGHNFTWTSGTNFSSSSLPWESGWLVHLTTTGSLPTGLSTGTDYFVYNSECAPYSATTFSLNVNSTSAIDGSSAYVTPTGAGSGTQTATSYPYLTQYGSLYTAQSNGQWNYIQGAGSIAADSTVRVVQNHSYMRSTGLIPPYAFSTYSPTDNTAFTANPMTAGPLCRYFEQTGERPDIGPLTTWAAVTLFNQTATDDTLMRVIGMAAGQLPINLRDGVTHSIPVVNGQTYSGMPASNTGFRWYGSTTNLSGITAPTNTAVYIAGYSVPDTSHLPDFEYVTFLLTGEPEYMDMIVELGNEAVFNRYPPTGTASVGAVTSIGGTAGGQRNNVISGTTYNGITLGGANLLRDDAWARRAVAEAAFINDPENASYQTYFKRMASDTTTAALAYINLFGGSYPWVTNNGVWDETSTSAGGVSEMWATGYFINTWNMSYPLTEDSNVPTFVNYLLKWPAHVNNTFGTSFTAFYQALIRQINNADTSPFVTSDANVAFQGLGITYTNGNPVLTLNGATPGYTVTANDRMMFNEQEPAAAPPGGFSGETPYFIENISGSTFELSATMGGSAITPTSSGATDSGSGYFYGTSLVPPNSISSTVGSGYVANLTAALYYSSANGFTVDATTETDMFSLLSAQPGYISAFNTDPKYAFQNSF